MSQEVCCDINISILYESLGLTSFKMSSAKDDPNRRLAQILNATKTKTLQTTTPTSSKPPVPSKSSKPPVPLKSSKPGLMKKWKGGANQTTDPNTVLEKSNEVPPKASNENYYTATPNPSISSKPLIQPEPKIPNKPLIPPKPSVPTKPAIPSKPAIPTKPTISTKPAIPTKPVIPTKPAIPTKHAKQSKPQILQKSEDVAIHEPPPNVLEIQNEAPPNTWIKDKGKSEIIHPLTPNAEICENYYTTIPSEPQISPKAKKINKWEGRKFQVSTPNVEILDNQNDNIEICENLYTATPRPSISPKPLIPPLPSRPLILPKPLNVDKTKSETTNTENQDNQEVAPKPQKSWLSSFKRFSIFLVVPVRMCVLYYMDILSDILQSFGLYMNCHDKFFLVSISIIVSSYMVTVLYVRFVLKCSWCEAIFYFVTYG